MIYGHSLMVAYTGLSFVISAMVLLAVGRLSGPTYHTKVNAPPWVIGFFFLASAILFWRASTILFPGDLVDVSRMSWVAAAEASVVAGLSVFILNITLRDRAPPPIFERLLGFRMVRTDEAQIINMAMNTNPAMHANPAPAEFQVTRVGRTQRITVLLAGAAIIAAILGFLVANSVPV
jgi:hypothetical protein